MAAVRLSLTVPSSPMASHRLVKSPATKLSRLSPFGLGHTKPKHFRDMAKVVWDNRDNLGHAWKVITKGVCDGCALGTAVFLTLFLVQLTGGS